MRLDLNNILKDSHFGLEQTPNSPTKQNPPDTVIEKPFNFDNFSEGRGRETSKISEPWRSGTTLPVFKRLL